MKQMNAMASSNRAVVVRVSLSRMMRIGSIKLNFAVMPREIIPCDKISFHSSMRYFFFHSVFLLSDTELAAKEWRNLCSSKSNPTGLYSIVYLCSPSNSFSCI